VSELADEPDSKSLAPNFELLLIREGIALFMAGRIVSGGALPQNSVGVEAITVYCLKLDGKIEIPVEQTLMSLSVLCWQPRSLTWRPWPLFSGDLVDVRFEKSWCCPSATGDDLSRADERGPRSR
jgi:hypothetical protein